MPRIYMIRHGKPAATWGDGSAHPDPGLDETGQAQARAAAAALLALPQPPTLVLTSPLARCRGTAKPFAEALGMAAVIEPRIAEIPTPAALSETERGPWLREAFQSTWHGIKGDIDYAAWRDAAAAAVMEHPGAAIFSHFVAINAAVAAATGDDRVLSFRPDHCAITTFEVVDGRLALIELGREAQTGVL